MMGSIKKGYPPYDAHVGDVLRKYSHLKLKLNVVLKATNNFADENLLGSGGFGNVYKGIAPDGSLWAVIRAHDPAAMKSSIREIVTMASFQNFHIVELLGFCHHEEDQPELILVYEFVENGSLAEALKRDHGSLSFKQRLHIAIGIADGLLHIHRGLKTGTMHGDIRPGNVLLDKNLEPKLANFGIAKMILGSEQPAGHQIKALTHFLLAKLGYMEPDLHESYKMTIQGDIFSLGVILLQLLTGKSAVFPDEGEKMVALYKWVEHRLRSDSLHSILDPSIAKEGIPDEQLQRFTKVAQGCLKKNPKQRLDILRVLVELEAVQEKEAVEDSLPVEDLASSPQVTSAQGITDVALDAERLYQMGMRHVYGQGARGEGRRDFAFGAACFSRAADLGHVPAQRELSDLCYYGLGVAPDEKVAQYWCLRAAEQENACALANCFGSGWGRAQNLEEAAKLYTEAAVAGDSIAQKDLGWMCLRGHDVEENQKTGAEWLRRAAEQGHVSAQLHLGICFYEGKGVDQDLKTAEHWFSLATHDNLFACYQLGLVFLKGDLASMDFSKTMYFYDRALQWEGKPNLNMGDKHWLANVHEKLGLFYHAGIGVAKDRDRARLHLHKAADLGDADAKEMLRKWGYERQEKKGFLNGFFSKKGTEATA